MTDALRSESTETELKLRLEPRQVRRIASRAPLSGVESSQIEIDNEYFDTADHLLRRHKMALRLRRVDGRWLQTLKTADVQTGAMARRGEWETPAKATADGGGQLDLRRLRDSPLESLLTQRKPRARLLPQFRTHVRRTRWILEREQAQIEVALDVGEIRSGAPGKGKRAAYDLRESICEVEIELKRGDSAAVVDVALALLDSNGKSPLTLIPVARSKAERGYQLAAQRPAAALKASAKGFTDRLKPKMSVASALRVVMAHGLAVVTTNCELLLLHDDTECVHQARVALRRVRSAIRLFDRARRDVPQSLSDELSWFARVLGAVRDWDVFVDQTLPKLATHVGDQVITDRLLDRADQKRREQHAKVRDAIRSPRYAALVLNGERWCMSPAPADSELLDGMAEATLQRSAKKLFKSARLFSALSPERRHRVRILSKRLRYALDLFSILLSKGTTARYTKALAGLQELLGELNDASVARAMFPKLGKASELPRPAEQWFIANECDQLRQAEIRLMALAELPSPWQ